MRRVPYETCRRQRRTNDGRRSTMHGYVTIHPWCLDPSRDEAVRAAEDGRTGPLPTLEEAIAVFSPYEEGLRTERVTLEIVRGDGLHVRRWPWHDILKAWGLGEEDEAESVRVVDEVHFDDLANMSLERDAAIRERDEAKQNHLRECAKCAALADKVISLRARVAELESAPAASGISSPQPISGDGKSAETGTQEPDAWGVRRKGGGVDAVIHRSQRRSAEHSAEQWGGTVVPLYAAPQPASGWLTAEERDALGWAVGADYDKQDKYALRALRALRARSTPPEVVLPPAAKGETPLVRDLMWGQAIRAAGVTLKEVGK